VLRCATWIRSVACRGTASAWPTRATASDANVEALSDAVSPDERSSAHRVDTDMRCRVGSLLDPSTGRKSDVALRPLVPQLAPDELGGVRIGREDIPLMLAPSAPGECPAEAAAYIDGPQSRQTVEPLRRIQ
jgi:hypothetical protein